MQEIELACCPLIWIYDLHRVGLSSIYSYLKKACVSSTVLYCVCVFACLHGSLLRVFCSALSPYFSSSIIYVLIYQLFVPALTSKCVCDWFYTAPFQGNLKQHIWHCRCVSAPPRTLPHLENVKAKGQGCSPCFQAWQPKFTTRCWCVLDGERHRLGEERER